MSTLKRDEKGNLITIECFRDKNMPREAITLIDGPRDGEVIIATEGCLVLSIPIGVATKDGDIEGGPPITVEIADYYRTKSGAFVYRPGFREVQECPI